jgi:hypothetical protein
LLPAIGGAFVFSIELGNSTEFAALGQQKSASIAILFDSHAYIMAVSRISKQIQQ